MNKDYPCRCGHSFSQHEDDIRGACLEGWTSHMPGCECDHFKMDNLALLEQLSEQANKI